MPTKREQPAQRQQRRRIGSADRRTAAVSPNRDDLVHHRLRRLTKAGRLVCRQGQAV
jgi:hypothetical protein